MGKYDLDDVINTVKKSLKKDESRASQVSKGSNLEPTSENPEDFIVMPDWFLESYGVLGFPFGKICQWAGKPDSGKTSIAIMAMKAAQEQGHAVLYVETEGKTTTTDLEAWGVDPENMMIIKSSITEEAFDNAFQVWDSFFDKYPDGKLLFIFDSYGNTVSLRDSELDMTEKISQVGGQGKTNRLGLKKLIAKMKKDKAAVLIINYTYSNLTSPGRTNAGGEALGFFSSLIVQTARKAWITSMKGGKKIRKGAKVKWNTYKNHLAKHKNGLPYDIEMDITSEGMKLAGKKEKEE